MEKDKNVEVWSIIRTSNKGYLRLATNKTEDGYYVSPIVRKNDRSDTKSLGFRILKYGKDFEVLVDKIHSLKKEDVGSVLYDEKISSYNKKRFLKELVKYNDLEKIDLSSVCFELKKGVIIINNHDTILIVSSRCEDGNFIAYKLEKSKGKQDTILIGGEKYKINYKEKEFINENDVKFFVTDGYEKLINPPKPNKQKKYKIGREVNLEGSKEKIIIIDKIQDTYLFVKNSDEGLFLGVDKSKNIKIKSLNRRISEEELIDILLKIEKVSSLVSDNDIQYLPKQTQNKIAFHLKRKNN